MLFWIVLVIVVLLMWAGYSSSGDAPDWLSSEQGLAKKQLREQRRTNDILKDNQRLQAENDRLRGGG